MKYTAFLRNFPFQNRCPRTGRSSTDAWTFYLERMSVIGMGTSPISDMVLMGWTLSPNIFLESWKGGSCCGRLWLRSRVLDLHTCNSADVNCISTNHSFRPPCLSEHLPAPYEIEGLALEGVDKERPGWGEPTRREDEKVWCTLTLATTLYPNRITVYIRYIYTKLPYPYI